MPADLVLKRTIPSRFPELLRALRPNLVCGELLTFTSPWRRSWTANGLWKNLSTYDRECCRRIAFDEMTSELTKLSAEISSNPLLSNSISGMIGLIGGVVGGAIAAWATAAGVRRSLQAQFELQRAEWERRDRERTQELQDRETIVSAAAPT